MRLIDTFSFFGRRTLEGVAPMVLLIGGVGKLASPKAAALALVSLFGSHLSYNTSESLVLGVASLEVVAAIGFFLSSYKIAASVLAGFMGIAFLLVSIIRHLSGMAGSCGCFGSFVIVESTWAQAAIAGLMFASSLLVFMSEYNQTTASRTGGCNAQIS